MSKDYEATNKKLVGLGYSGPGGPPAVILKCAGHSVDDILDIAQRLPTPVPVVDDPDLLERLYRLPVDAEIGTDLYELVALILVRVLSVDDSNFHR